MKKSAVSIVIILVFAVSMMVAFHSVDALVSVSQGSTKTTITLNEFVDFWVDVNPSVSIQWYCNDVLVQSEYTSHSNYTFTPKSIGTYMIKLSVAGFTKPSGPTKVTVISTPISPTTTQTPQSSVIRFYNDTHFALNQKLWAFAGFHLVCSFNANANDYLQFNVVSTNSDPNRPNDVYSVSFKIESANHNTSYVSGTSFHQEVKLNYTDTFNVYLVKHPFSATVTVKGSIDLHRSGLTTPTTTQASTPTLQPTINTGSETPKPEPFPTMTIAIVFMVAIVLLAAGLLVSHKRRAKQFSQETLMPKITQGCSSSGTDCSFGRVMSN